MRDYLRKTAQRCYPELLAAALCLAAVLFAPVEAAPPETFDQAEIQSWIDGLHSDQFAIREWATQKLIQGGPQVIIPLADSIANVDVEATLRGLDILRTLALKELDTSANAENAIRKLAANRATASSIRADEVLQSIVASRTQRAEKILTRLGANFLVTAISSYGYSYSSPTIKTITFDDRWAGTIEDLVFLSWLTGYRGLTIEAQGNKITDEWLREVAKLDNLVSLKLGRSRITDNGMEAIQDMSQLRDLRIHYCDVSDAWLKYIDSEESGLRSFSVFGSRITEEAVKNLSKNRPQLVTRYGVGGFLGIRGLASRNGEGCQVTEVTANAAASQSDIRANDLIVEYNGQRVTQFAPLQQRLQNRALPVLPQENENENETKLLSLSELIGKNAPGERVRVKIKRGGRYIMKDVVLGEWP